MKQLSLSSTSIRLRALEAEDVDVMCSIENDPALWSISNTTVPYSRYAIKQYLLHTSGDIYSDRQLRLVIEKQDSDEAVGLIDLIDFQPLHNRAEVGIVVRKEYRQNRIGKDSLMLLTDYCFKYLHLNQLYAYIPVDNEASRNLFASCGFKECALLKEWLRGENGYRDVLIVQRSNVDTVE